MYNILNNLQKEQYINLIKNGDLWIMGRIVILCFTFLVISSSLSLLISKYIPYIRRGHQNLLTAFTMYIYVVNSLVHVYVSRDK